MARCGSEGNVCCVERAYGDASGLRGEEENGEGSSNGEDEADEEAEREEEAGDDVEGDDVAGWLVRRGRKGED